MSFTAAGNKIIQGVAAGLYESGTIVMAASQILVPVEYGVLKGSGRVEEPVLEDGGDSMTVTVGYGYGGAYQARATESNPGGRGYGFWVEVREFTRSGRRVFHKPPTQAHYLEDPAKAFEPEFPHVLEHAISERLRA